MRNLNQLPAETDARFFTLYLIGKTGQLSLLDMVQAEPTSGITGSTPTDEESPEPPLEAA